MDDVIVTSCCFLFCTVKVHFVSLFEMVSCRLGWPQTSYVDLNLILLPLPSKCQHYRDKLSRLAASMYFISIRIKVWHVLGGCFLSMSLHSLELKAACSVLACANKTYQIALQCMSLSLSWVGRRKIYFVPLCTKAKYKQLVPSS